MMSFSRRGTPIRLQSAAWAALHPGDEVSVTFWWVKINRMSLRGVPLNDIRLIFTHQNVTETSSPGCSAAQAADCNLMGVPRLENDIMLFAVALDVNVAVTSFFVSYG